MPRVILKLLTRKIGTAEDSTRRRNRQGRK